MHLIRNPPFCPFVSFSIVLLREALFSRDLTIYISSSTSLFEIVNVVIFNPRIFLCIPSSNATVNPNVIKAHGLMVWAHFLLKASQFWGMIQEVCLEILLTVPS